MSIEIKNLTKRFGSLTALDKVSFTLEENRIYGLLGNNGAGKTTLLSVITNRLYPDEGQVLIDGESVFDNDNALGKIFMLSEANLYPEEMKVFRAFKAAALFYPNFDAEYADKLSKLFGLDTRKKIIALSTGYASIFRLIMAFSVNTPYLFLDEPVLGLDAQHRDMFYKLLLEKYAQKPCTILISTHLIQEAAGLIEHAIIIHNGRLLRNLPSDDLLAEVYNVSGSVSLVNSYIAGKNVLSENTIGGLKTACIEGRADDLPAGLEFSRAELQDYFISLMNKEEAK